MLSPSSHSIGSRSWHRWLLAGACLLALQSPTRGVAASVELCRQVFEAGLAAPSHTASLPVSSPLTEGQIQEALGFTRSFLGGGKDEESFAFQAEQLWNNSKAFRRLFAEETGSGMFRSELASRTLIAKHYRRFIERFQGPQRLAKLRSQALMRALGAHGAELHPHRTGQENLAAVSAENLRRVLEPSGAVERFFDHPEIMSFVESIEVSGHRNSHSLVVHGNSVLSARQIREWGAGARAGFNTFKFNERLVKTDDQVFFFLRIDKKGAEKAERPSEYGHATRYIESAYAREHGWVSAFLMWPNQLVQFTKRNTALESQALNSSLRRYQQLESGRFEDLSRQDQETIGQALSQLHRLDFTVKDFETVLRTFLGRELLERKQSMSGLEWHEYMEKLDAKSNTFDELITERILEGRLGFVGMGAELKVPVLVPLSGFR